MALCELENISRIEEEMNQLEVMRIREEMKMEGAVKETPVDINVFGLYGHFNILTIIVVIVAIGLGLQGRWMMTGNDLLLDHLAEMSHSSKEDIASSKWRQLENNFEDLMEKFGRQKDVLQELVESNDRMKKELKLVKESLEKMKASNRKMLEKILDSVEEPVVVVKKRNFEE